MISKLRSFWLSRLTILIGSLSKNERTRQVALNSALGLVYRSGALLISFVQVRLLYNSLGKGEYGLWILIQSVISWFLFFEFGFSNGLRNKFAEAYSQGNQHLAKQYLNTALAAILLISLALLLIFAGSVSFIDWQGLFNTSHILPETDIRTLVVFVFVSFIGLLILQVFNGVIYALQLNRYISQITLVTQMVQLIAIYLCLYLNHVNLLHIAFLLCLTPVLVQALMVGIFFHKHLDFSYIDLRLASYQQSAGLVSMSLKFLVLNLTGIVLYTTDNMLIARLFSPDDVSTYNVVYKYFGLPNVLFGMLTAPLWSAFTDAYARQDATWIKRTLRKVTLFCFGFLGVQLVLLVLSTYVYRIWIGEQFTVPFLLNISMMLFFSLQLFLQGYVALINGTGQLKAQMIHSVVGAILNVPLSIYLAKSMHFGPAGVILATLATQALAIFWLPWQINHIVAKLKS